MGDATEVAAFLGGRVTLWPGDCLEVLRKMLADSVDAVVTDPPYHLTSIVKRFGKGGAAAPKTDGATGVYKRSASGFMGQTWDGGDMAFRAETWKTVSRVLKPGGHLLAFSAPKNFGHLQIALEGAGFEIRDCLLDVIDLDPAVARFVETLSAEQAAAFARLIDESTFGGLLAWIFGTGFPKSHDVSKTIDKRRDWSALPRLQDAIRKARKRLRLSQSAVARVIGMIGPGESLGGGGFMWFETGMRVPTCEQWAPLKRVLRLGDDFDGIFEEAVREITGTVEPWKDRSNYALRTKDGLRRDKPATDLAAKWSGWGTALKPAFEPIVMARKSLDAGSVAANVLRHGTGALNVDACRISAESTLTRHYAEIGYGGGNKSTDYITGSKDGRWPANVIHDNSAAALAGFPDAPGDSGSAARFFYGSKADSHDRSGSRHPTVKPVELMRWLIRLVTPPGGVVLDPFAGTGTTGEAAFVEGFRAVLIERESEFRDDIAKRMRLLQNPGERRAVAAGRDKPRGAEGTPLFNAPAANQED